MSVAQSLAPQTVPRRRWGIACLLGFGVLVNFFDRVNLTVAHDALHATFNISTVTYGYLLSAYIWTYAACQIPVGVLLDRFGVKKVGRIGAFVWSMGSHDSCSGSAKRPPSRLTLRRSATGSRRANVAWPRRSSMRLPSLPMPSAFLSSACC